MVGISCDAQTRYYLLEADRSLSFAYSIFILYSLRADITLLRDEFC